MYGELAQYYDRIYASKDYATEAAKLQHAIGPALHAGRRRLLDVACGTGRHLEFLARDFDVEGLDLSPDLLAVAHQRLPNVPLHVGDMRHFNLHARFDVITCLFSSIGYMATADDLHRAIANMARHLDSGGLLIVEPWFTPETWHPGSVHALLIDDPNLKIARVSTSFVEGDRSIFDLHHLIGEPTGTRHTHERHEMGLYTVAEIKAAFIQAGLEVAYDEDGPTGRGLYIGKEQP